MSWVAVLRKMRNVLRGMGYDQVPQLTSSRMIDVDKTMHIVPPGTTGNKRAVLIGINYVFQKGQLSGCHNDVGNIKDYLQNALGFRDQDMLVLMDDGRHHPPTRQNILNAYKRVAEYSKAGDVVFIHYSGTNVVSGAMCASSRVLFRLQFYYFWSFQLERVIVSNVLTLVLLCDCHLQVTAVASGIKMVGP